MAARSPAWRFLLRAIREQRGGVVRAVLSGMTWQAAAVAAPLFVKEAIDQGVVHGDRTALYAWCGAILGVGVVEALGGAFRHTTPSATARAATRTCATRSTATR